jgi:hypothetical protein
LTVCPQTLRRWLGAAGLWQRRRRDPHRSRRARRACFGELVQRDAAEHDWLEGRGGEVVLVSLIGLTKEDISIALRPDISIVVQQEKAHGVSGGAGAA